MDGPRVFVRSFVRGADSHVVEGTVARIFGGPDIFCAGATLQLPPFWRQRAPNNMGHNGIDRGLPAI